MSSAPTKNCIHCGSEIALGTLTCPYCRGGQTPGSSPPEFPRVKITSRYVYEERPAGVTALAVLMILAGAYVLVLIPIVKALTGTEEVISEFGAEHVAVYEAITVGFLTGAGAIGIILAVGLLLLRNWARIATVILAGALAALGIFGIVVQPGAPGGYIDAGLGILVGIYLVVVSPYFGKRTVHYVAKGRRP